MKKKKKKKRLAHFSMAGYAIQCVRRVFHSYLNETKQNQHSILKWIAVLNA